MDEIMFAENVGHDGAEVRDGEAVRLAETYADRAGEFGEGFGLRGVDGGQTMRVSLAIDGTAFLGDTGFCPCAWLEHVEDADGRCGAEACVPIVDVADVMRRAEEAAEFVAFEVGFPSHQVDVLEVSGAGPSGFVRFAVKGRLFAFDGDGLRIEDQ